jgi:hypothetical protein
MYVPKVKSQGRKMMFPATPMTTDPVLYLRRVLNRPEEEVELLRGVGFTDPEIINMDYLEALELNIDDLGKGWFVKKELISTLGGLHDLIRNLYGLPGLGSAIYHARKSGIKLGPESYGRSPPKE